MFTFQERDEGWLVLDKDGRGVCDVQTCTQNEKWEPKTKQMINVFTHWDRKDWKVHFCSRKFTIPELDELLKQIPEKK